jgi:hypothetical protein
VILSNKGHKNKGEYMKTKALIIDHSNGKREYNYLKVVAVMTEREAKMFARMKYSLSLKSDSLVKNSDVMLRLIRLGWKYKAEL